MLTDQSSLSVLWPLFNAEWNAGETKVEGLGGVTNYYERDANGVPRRWMAIVKESIRTVAPRFAARRMVKQYVERMYAPALEQRLEVSR